MFSKIDMFICLFERTIYIPEPEKVLLISRTYSKKIFQCALCLDQNKNTCYNSATIKSFWILKNGWLEKREIIFYPFRSGRVFPISGKNLSKIHQCAHCLNLEYQKIQGNIKLPFLKPPKNDNTLTFWRMDRWGERG